MAYLVSGLCGEEFITDDKPIRVGHRQFVHCLHKMMQKA